MQVVNIDSEYEKIFVDFNQDISLFHTWTMIIEPQYSNIQQKEEIVANVGLFDQVVGDEVYIRDQYVYRSIVPDFFKEAGLYRKKAIAWHSGLTAISTDFTFFRVTE